MKSYIVDTYAWIAYFEGREKFKEVIEENELYTPSIVLAEISRILKRKRVPEDKRTKILEFIKERSLILSLDENNAVEAGETAEKEGLYLIDGIIYSYADEHTHLSTGDKHFRNKSFVDLIEDEI
ncbi:TPA: type II toxin-antitoxin system VapC family toxin [Candidatus Bathyarchaeota archaeon]|nr:type II toxin-antitoxin system VapC family toxin [Candidatus Bathyarchaeota archaeon]